MNFIAKEYEECENIISVLSAVVERQGYVTLGYLKSITGHPDSVTYMDEQIGWVHFNDLVFTQDVEFWVLTIPEPINISIISSD